jgi:hypothetical protein
MEGQSFNWRVEVRRASGAVPEARADDLRVVRNELRERFGAGRLLYLVGSPTLGVLAATEDEARRLAGGVTRLVADRGLSLDVIVWRREGTAGSWQRAEDAGLEPGIADHPLFTAPPVRLENAAADWPSAGAEVVIELDPIPALVLSRQLYLGGTPERLDPPRRLRVAAVDEQGAYRLADELFELVPNARVRVRAFPGPRV